MAYELINVTTEAGKVGVITLNRPKQLNALNSQLMLVWSSKRPMTSTHTAAQQLIHQVVSQSLADNVI